MNTFEFTRLFEKLTPTVVRQIGVEAVHLNAAKSYSTDFSDGFAANDGNVFSDMFRANNSGKTFDNNNIVGVLPRYSERLISRSSQLTAERLECV